MRCILILLLFVTLSSCSGDKDGLFEGLSEEEIDLSETLKEKFGETENLIYANDTLLASKEVLTYYKENEFIPIWTTSEGLNESGTEFVQLINESYKFGFLPEMFNASLIKQTLDSSLLDTELILSNAFFLFDTHISVGCVDSSTYSYVWKKDKITYSLTDELTTIRKGDKVRETILAHQPDFWEYRQLQKGLSNFLDSFDLDTNHYVIPAIKEDSLNCYLTAKTALQGHDFLSEKAATDDTLFLNQLKKFQELNGLKPDAVIGKWTGRALEKSNLDRFYQAALSLEKWRWHTPRPSRYIRVNSPEFYLYYVDSAQTLSKHRVVVGAYATQTPEFQAQMQRMVTNPFWHVPYSISSTEILVGARKDTSYFNKRGYKVFKGGAEVDPKNVDWKAVKENNFQYRIRQEGGGGNSLGRIKFLFPNEHSVFIHDTPSKSLFGNDVRAYSHGCVRLQDPFDLAKKILATENHKMLPDELDSVVKRGQQKVLELSEPFAVYIEYFTASADSNDAIIFHPDIYGRDEKYIKRAYKPFVR
ncbi:MAG: L,D-transpeptidase family protein [Crocinitomix sp.]|nr:L,D-transpeptidase family protein [Crocinitomix sp.]